MTSLLSVALTGFGACSDWRSDRFAVLHVQTLGDHADVSVLIDSEFAMFSVSLNKDADEIA